MSYADKIPIRVTSLKRKDIDFTVKSWICKYLIYNVENSYKFGTQNLEGRILKYLQNQNSLEFSVLKYIVFPNNKLPKDSKFRHFIKNMEERGLIIINNKKYIKLKNTNL